MRFLSAVSMLFIVLIPALVFALVAVPGATRPVSADPSCIPPRSAGYGNWKTGWWRGLYVGFPAHDVMAAIEEYDPYLYLGGYTSSAWVMLQRNDSFKFGQIGWRKGPTVGLRETFVQYTTPTGGLATQVWPAEPVGSLTVYRVQYSSIFPGRFYYYYKGALVKVSSPNFTPNSAGISGEITNYKNQMPGGYYAHVWMYAGQYRDTPNGPFYAFDQGGGADWYNNDPREFSITQQTQSDIEIWDRRCPY